MTGSAAARLRHDLRTPLNHIVGYAEMLLEDAEASDQPLRAGALARILVVAREMVTLVDREAEGGRLGQALAGPAAAVRAELDGLVVASSEADAADLRRMDEALGRLLQYAAANAAGGESPAGHSPVEARAASPASAERLLSGCRVLVVDDDAVNRELLGRRTEREGCAVAHAAGGAEALAMLESQAFDVVLLDLLMPGMSGEGVLRRLKGDARHADLPVLMISALDEQESIVRCIEAGAEDYLPKGVAPALLRARLGACLRKKRARDEELAYLRDVRALTAGAAALQEGGFEPSTLDGVGGRNDALGTLARVFVGMAVEVRAREARLAAQVAELRIEIDEAKKARAVAEIVETDHFQDLQRRAAELRRPGALR